MPISFVELPAGTPILLGPPAKPMDSNLVRAIGRLVGSIEDVVEAHLPQCFAVCVMEEPSQVLVLVLKSSSSNLDMIGEHLDQGLREILSPGIHLDVWPMTSSHSMLDDIRRTGCMIPI